MNSACDRIAEERIAHMHGAGESDALPGGGILSHLVRAREAPQRVWRLTGRK